MLLITALSGETVAEIDLESLPEGAELHAIKQRLLGFPRLRTRPKDPCVKGNPLFRAQNGCETASKHHVTCI